MSDVVFVAAAYLVVLGSLVLYAVWLRRRSAVGEAVARAVESVVDDR